MGGWGELYPNVIWMLGIFSAMQHPLFIFNCSKLMRHNVIFGKSFGGYLEFRQIRPLIKEGFCNPPKNIKKLNIQSPCVKCAHC